MQIGDGVRIMAHSWLTRNMTIGNDVLISGGVLTSNDNAFARRGYEKPEEFGPVGEGSAAMGAGAVLFPDIRIGVGAVVGAGLVATKDVQPSKFVLGAPGKIWRDV